MPKDLGRNTVVGSNHKGALVPISGRITSKVWLHKLSGKDAAPLALKTTGALQPIKNFIHTRTADNEEEFVKRQQLTKELEISFYFCKPYHAWERGNNSTAFASWIYQKKNNK